MSISHSLELSIIVPAFNEAQTIETVLRALLALPCPIREILVVDDGSKDDTRSIVNNVSQENPKIRLISHTVNSGKTAAIRTGLKEAQGGIVLIQDADLEYDPTEIPEVIEPIQAGRADVVYGSRFLVRKAARVLYFSHYVANKTLTFFSNVLTNRNMTDVETCYKAFRSEVIKPLILKSHGFGMEIEITAMICKTKASTYEVPISYYGRTYEEGKKIGLKDGIAALWYIFYFNLIAPFLPSGRHYIQTVNNAIDQRNR
jgi:glycosyltransferase involved in cell wall biosynthesis